MANLNADDEILLHKAMGASDAALLRMLGEHAVKSTPGLSPRDIGDLIAQGRQELRSIYEKSRTQLCSESIRTKLRDIDDGDSRKAVLAIMDIVLDQRGLPPAMYASILLCRGLLDTWCAELPR